MFVLILGVIFGLGIAYFATQNTTPVTIHFANYMLEQVPLYLVIVGSLFAGLLIAWILYVARCVSSRVAIYEKDTAVRRARQTAADLEQRVRELEAENERLKRAHISLAERSPHAAP
ncbi:MAG TPA: LapA family protein [Candidatus Acidoferrales bacterium]|nr:LapA family protein [Candidatus Acidoferrales bacterium]